MTENISCQETKTDTEGYNGKFPDRAILAFHRESFGIVDGMVEIKFFIESGQHKGFKVSRSKEEFDYA